MNPKIIKSDLYKKTTSKQAKKKKKEIIRNVKNNKYSKNNNTKVRKRFKTKSNTFFKIVICIVILISIGLLSKKLLKLEQIPIIKAFFNEDESNFVKDYNFKIGVLNVDDIKLNTTKNLTLNEIIRFSSLKLIDYKDDYKINFLVAKNISTEDNKTFLIELSNDYDVSSEDVKNAINYLIALGDQNIYFNYLSKIERMDIIDNKTLNVSLKESEPYFIYSLNFPINNLEDSTNINTKYYASSVNENEIIFQRNNIKNNISTITFTNYQNDSTLIDDFRNQKLDMFTTTSESTINLIGKYEYSIKKVRNGESIFLLGNKESKLYSRKEVRQALAYSLNREELIKDISNSFSEVIDLPYIYSKTAYKYDTYAATNALLSNGFKKIGGVYTLTENDVKIDLVLNLLVNKDDSIKVKLANNLKQMLEENSIKINLELLSIEEIDARIQDKNYDLILANINMNENPDIEYIENYININDNINNAIKEIENNKDLTLTSDKILNLQSILSEEIACIGICAYNTDIIYQKYIQGFEDLKYLNIFNEFESIGKVEEID